MNTAKERLQRTWAMIKGLGLPILRQTGYRPVAVPLIQAAGVRFRWVGWMALGTLVVTGVANLFG